MNRRMRVIVCGSFFVAVLGLMMAGCPSSPEQGPPKVPATQDGAFPVIDPDQPNPGDSPTEASAQYPWCVRACAKLKDQGCPEAATLPGGKTCYRVCADGETNGLGLKPQCVAAATSLDGVRLCGTVRCRK